MSAPALAVEALSLRLGGFRLHDVDLSLDAGEVLAVLGPNGAGKSVTLEAIAGFHRPHSGRIAIAGGDVTALPPERRRVGLMPQNFALFPHLTVADNVALPIRIAAGTRTRGGTVARRQAMALLERFGIPALADRFPALLSPGERQRAALARALAARPLVFLFDEPFSALDAAARRTLRAELGEFLRDAAIPAVFVTHDPEEAALLAGRVAIMRGGGIVQQGPAGEVYRRPADVETARFLGVENILAARAEGGGGRPGVVIGKSRLGAGGRAPSGDGGAVFACIRAEEVALGSGAGEPPQCSNRLAATVRAIGGAGPLVTVSLDCGFPLVARLMARDARALGLAPGAAVVAEIADEAIHLVA